MSPMQKEYLHKFYQNESLGSPHASYGGATILSGDYCGHLQYFLKSIMGARNPNSWRLSLRIYIPIPNENLEIKILAIMIVTPFILGFYHFLYSDLLACIHNDWMSRSAELS